MLEAASGFEPLNRGFADPRLNHLATPPWCRGGDLNSYGLTPTTPSRWRVYRLPPPRLSFSNEHIASPFSHHILAEAFALGWIAYRGFKELAVSTLEAHRPLWSILYFHFPDPLSPCYYGRSGRTRSHDRRFWSSRPRVTLCDSDRITCRLVWRQGAFWSCLSTPSPFIPLLSSFSLKASNER